MQDRLTKIKEKTNPNKYLENSRIALIQKIAKITTIHKINALFIQPTIKTAVNLKIKKISILTII